MYSSASAEKYRRQCACKVPDPGNGGYPRTAKRLILVALDSVHQTIKFETVTNATIMPAAVFDREAATYDDGGAAGNFTKIHTCALYTRRC